MSIILVPFLVGVVVTATGLLYGYSRGRAYGWQEGYFERENWEKKRRDQQGKFKPLAS